MSDAGFAPNIIETDETYRAEEMLENDQINGQISNEIFLDRYLQKQIAELICKFNYNKDLLKLYGVKKVRSKDVAELFPEIATVKFIENEQEGQYWKFYDEFMPIYAKIKPILKDKYPHIFDQYESILNLLYSDIPFFVEQYEKFMPMTIEDAKMNPHWLVFGHNDISWGNILRENYINMENMM